MDSIGYQRKTTNKCNKIKQDDDNLRKKSHERMFDAKALKLKVENYLYILRFIS